MRRSAIFFVLTLSTLFAPSAFGWWTAWKVEARELQFPSLLDCYVCPGYWVEVKNSDGIPFYRTSNNAMSTWSSWEGLGGRLYGNPTVTSMGPGNFHIFVRGTDNKLYHKWYDGAFHDWESLGGVIISSPFSYSTGLNYVSVCARGTDENIWCRHWIP